MRDGELPASAPSVYLPPGRRGRSPSITIKMGEEGGTGGALEQGGRVLERGEGEEELGHSLGGEQDEGALEQGGKTEEEGEEKMEEKTEEKMEETLSSPPPALFRSSKVPPPVPPRSPKAIPSSSPKFSIRSMTTASMSLRVDLMTFPQKVPIGAPLDPTRTKSPRVDNPPTNYLTTTTSSPVPPRPPRPQRKFSPPPTQLDVCGVEEENVEVAEMSPQDILVSGRPPQKLSSPTNQDEQVKEKQQQRKERQSQGDLTPGRPRISDVCANNFVSVPNLETSKIKKRDGSAAHSSRGAEEAPDVSFSLSSPRDPQLMSAKKAKFIESK